MVREWHREGGSLLRRCGMYGTMVRVGGWRSHGGISGKKEIGFQGEREVSDAGHGACSSFLAG